MNNGLFSKNKCNCNNPPTDDDNTITLPDYGILSSVGLTKRILMQSEDMTVTEGCYETACDSSFHVYKPNYRCLGENRESPMTIIGTGMLDFPSECCCNNGFFGIYEANNITVTSGSMLPLQSKFGIVQGGSIDLPCGKYIINYSLYASTTAGNNEITVTPMLGTTPIATAVRVCLLAGNGKYTSVYNSFYIEVTAQSPLTFTVTSSNGGDVTAVNMFVSVQSVNF